MTEYCKEMVRLPGAWLRSQCDNKAKRDGYCGTHHPDAVKRRRDKSDTQYKIAAAEFDANDRRESFNIRAGDRCRALGIEPEEIKA